MAEVIAEGLSANNPLFRVYAFNCSVLVLKMLAMSILTAVHRFKTKSYANLEDAVIHRGKVRQNDIVERVRSCHWNDVENITIFLLVSLIYLLTKPSYVLGSLLIRVFTLARFVHTFVYAIADIPQPSRFLSWAVGFAITGYMAFQDVVYFLM